MFDYIANETIKDAVTRGYKICHEADNYSAFVNFLDALNLEPSISMQVIIDVLKDNGPKFEGLELGLKSILSDTGIKTYNTVSLTKGDEGIRELNFSEPHPYHTVLPVINQMKSCDVNVYSILGRTPASGISDGNPLIYALKRIKNWRLGSVSEFEKLVDYFMTVCERECGDGFLHDIDVVIPVPSSAHINKAMVGCITRRIEPSILSLDYLKKQSVDNAYDQIDESIIELNLMPKLYPNVKSNTVEYNKALNTIISDLDKAKKKNTEENTLNHIQGNPFAIKYVPPRYRSIFTDYIVGGFPDGILTGTNVLVVDDSISTGQSLSGIISTYILPQSPKSVTALTLLSPLIR